MQNLFNNKQGVNFRFLTFLFAFSILMHFAAPYVKAEHPLLGWLLAVLETVGWITILTVWVIALIKGIRYGGPKLWKKIWMYVRTHVRIKNVKNPDLIVPVGQLKQLRNNIQRLGLALHGLTPEMENARRLQFEMLGEAVPDPSLPPQNAVLYAEFESLIRFLNHFGFPNLESVRLQNKEFQFAWKWGSDLQARLHQAQKSYTYQQQMMEWMLSEADKKLEDINSKYQQVQDDAGYQRIQGALKLLKRIAHHSHRPEEVTSYLAALMQDMESLRKQLKQAVA